MPTTKKRVLAIVAHPDDIEFVMAGTLLLLADRDWSVHMTNLANGCCGSMQLGRKEIAAIREKESRESAKLLKATYYAPIADDLAIEYSQSQLAKVASIVRQADPSILLTHSPTDYMEDHEIACRLAVTGAFVKSMPNFECDPTMTAIDGDIAVYHAQPHGNRTPLGDPVKPQLAVDIQSVLPRKQAMLECHASQRGWLDATQGMSSYIQNMMDAGWEVGRICQRQGFYEGWRQRTAAGFGPEGWDPLGDALQEAAFQVDESRFDPKMRLS